MRAAMPGIELDGAAVMLECEVVLLQVAIRKSKVVLQVGVLGVAYFRPLQKSRGFPPILLFERPLGRGIVLVLRREIGIRISRVGGRDREECRDRRAQQAGTNKSRE